MNVIRTLSLPTLACALYLTQGCGGAGPPTQSQSDAVAAVRSARELGAESTPQASYHLALADDQMTQAEALIAQGRHEQAQLVLERAKVDAELAIALRREDAVRAHADERHEHIDTLRDSQTVGPVPTSTTTSATTTTVTTSGTVSQ
jgi:hypothetical protein